MAQKNRLQLTHAEKLLWEKLRKKKLEGRKFRCQHPVDRYILDFYCHSERLAVEVDGEVHQIRKEYDKIREKNLLALNIRTIRFTNAEVINEIDNVLNKIKSEFKHSLNPQRGV
ncbi:MAG: endonuclease domain-containing protein [Spirochaetota bacterium]